jgi:thioredoxin 1
MQSHFRSSAKIASLAVACAAALAIAGCMGRNGLVMPWSQASDSRLEHVTAANFDERVLKCDKPVLVDFYAEWCGPCKQLTPILEQFSDEHPEVRVVKVNVDDSPELTKRYGVDHMPTLLVFRGGKITSQSVGWVPKTKIQEMAAEGATTEATSAAESSKKAI